MKTIIYHNPSCSKSREALNLLIDQKEDIEIINYMEGKLSKEELIDILNKLGVDPEVLVRKSEKIYKESFAEKNFTKNQWIDILVNNPILIERPIVVKGKKAIIGRPPKNIIDIL